MRFFRRSAESETDRVRGGGGPLENLCLVPITSLILLAIIGGLLLWFFGYFPGGHPALTEHG